MSTSILTAVLALVLLAVVQVAFFQLSCSICGQARPGVKDTLLTLVTAAFFTFLASAAWGCTGGLLLTLFVGKWAAAAAQIAVGLFATSVVYRGKNSFTWRHLAESLKDLARLPAAWPNCLA